MKEIKATVTFGNLSVYQMGRILHFASRIKDLPEPSIHIEKDRPDFWITDNGPNRIQVIKALRTVMGWGLKEAKDFSDIVARSPAMLKAGVSPDEALRFQVALTEAGARIELR